MAIDFELSEEKIRSIVVHLAHLRAEYGDAFAAPDLIEPNNEYFPDEFTLDPEGIEQLLQRMLGYSPLSDDLDIGLGFIQPDGEVTGGGCGSGACGTGGLKEIARGGAVETDDGYAALVHVQDVGDPAILTTTLARSIGRIVMFEAGEDIENPKNEGPLSELTAIASGMGLLLLNGSCIYKKGCGGMKRHQATFLEIDEIALGLALFVRMTDKKASVVRRHLEITQREHFDAALGWVDTQPTLVRSLTSRPETLTDGVFAFESKKGIFSRLFSGKRGEKSEEEEMLNGSPISRRTQQRSEEEIRRLAEAKALVEEALSDS